MKTSTILIALLALNSGVLASKISSLVIGDINPLLIGGSELVLLGSYYTHYVIKQVRNVFNVEIRM
jgi:hypothetical protein